MNINIIKSFSTKAYAPLVKAIVKRIRVPGIKPDNKDQLSVVNMFVPEESLISKAHIHRSAINRWNNWHYLSLI